ncbi:MAG: chromosomal replication initiator protein DnaA, partial [Dysgonamonadaceae bacterium]|nr:chromosomal replication initiator protein DnaA [Dysgonamonadaceae bacterium]
METYRQIWSECLGIIQDNIPENHYQIWFKPIVPVKYEKDDYTIQVPSSFFYEYLESHYADLIYHTLVRVTGKTINLYYLIEVDSTNQQEGLMVVKSDNGREEQKPASSITNKAPEPIPLSEWDPNLNSKLNFANFFS